MFKKLLLVSAFVAGSAAAANATVVFADNFNGNTADQLSTTPLGWSATQGSVDIIGAGGGYDWYPGNGSYIDMNGSTGASGHIVSNAVLNLVTGQTYTLSFNYGNNKNSSTNGSTETLDFGFGAHLATQLAVTGNIPTYLVMTYTFIATAADALGASLFFNGGGTNEADNGGIIIDNVSLSSVPLPGALPLLVTGLLGVGAMGRFRARARS